MSLYRGMDLFGSGPHSFVVRGREQRVAGHVGPGVDGERVTGLGRTGRRIDQRGTLWADDVSAMESLRDRIESVMDGETGQLVDDLERVHEGVVMLGFEAEAVRRVGVRLAMDYAVRYLQVRT